MIHKQPKHSHNELADKTYLTLRLTEGTTVWKTIDDQIVRLQAPLVSYILPCSMLCTHPTLPDSHTPDCPVTHRTHTSSSISLSLSVSLPHTPHTTYRVASGSRTCPESHIAAHTYRSTQHACTRHTAHIRSQHQPSHLNGSALYDPMVLVIMLKECC